MGEEMAVETRARSPRMWRLGLALAALGAGLLLLGACAEMAVQPSYQRQEAPLSLPAGSVPASGKPQTFTQEQALALTNPFAGQPAAVQAGQRLYGINCRMCHGADGKGTGAIAQYFPPKPTDLTGQRVLDLSDGQIFWTITNGFARMPDFQKKLTVDERWQIVTYVRSLQVR